MLRSLCTRRLAICSLRDCSWLALYVNQCCWVWWDSATWCLSLSFCGSSLRASDLRCCLMSTVSVLSQYGTTCPWLVWNNLSLVGMEQDVYLSNWLWNTRCLSEQLAIVLVWSTRCLSEQMATVLYSEPMVMVLAIVLTSRNNQETGATPAYTGHPRSSSIGRFS